MALRSWLTSSFVRHYPQTPPPRRAKPLAIECALNETFSFQAVLRMSQGEPRLVHLELEGPRGWALRARRVGYVPVRHLNTPVPRDPADVEGLGRIPGFAPDPLFDEDSLLLAQGETHAFWVSIRPGRSASPGKHQIQVVLHPEKGQAIRHTVDVHLHDLALKKRRNFDITHWFYADSILDWYRLEPFERRFWPILERYVRDYTDHGLNTLYVPVFTPPLDGVKRPTQLLRVTRGAKGKYRFDWRDVKRWIDLAKRCGVERFEWCHPFTQWGVKHAIRIYENQGREEKRLWSPSTAATSSTYREFLEQYLPQLHRFLSEENILGRSFFHVSDEPGGEEALRNYKKARALLRELAPWMQVMDALSEIEFARQGLTDMPVPSISRALEFAAEGVPSWCYYCCGPRGRFLNRLIDTPLAKIAMHGFLFYRWPFRGFLHWGYNYWYESQTRNLIDPFTVQDGQWWPGWASGDPFQVYPGPDGPVDSMRWEVFAESLQDYALLQTLGVERDDPLLAPLRSFEDFPKTEAWRVLVRKHLLERRRA